MPDRFTARLWGQVQAHQAIEAAWRYAKPMLLAEPMPYIFQDCKRFAVCTYKNNACI